MDMPARTAAAAAATYVDFMMTGDGEHVEWDFCFVMGRVWSAEANSKQRKCQRSSQRVYVAKRGSSETTACAATVFVFCLSGPKESWSEAGNVLHSRFFSVRNESGGQPSLLFGWK